MENGVTINPGSHGSEQKQNCSATNLKCAEIKAALNYYYSRYINNNNNNNYYYYYYYYYYSKQPQLYN